MDVSYTVRGATQTECQLALDDLCTRLGARPTNPPANPVGRGWVARAVPSAKALAENGRLLAGTVPSTGQARST